VKIKTMLPIFSSVFMAELGDKTQVATMLFMAGGAAGAAEVFAAAGAALLLSTFLAVMFGAAIGRLISPRALKAAAGSVFVLLGAYYLYQGVA
jgi:putative Ca2+/H+ antiporter (TMEM165/GDT1 family)